MSSSERTQGLHLNKWLGSDIPERMDFVTDNILIDTAVSTHRNNDDIHVSIYEKTKWNAPYYIGTYAGNGASSRTVDLGCGFEPKWGIIFPVNKMPGISDFSNEAHYNYFALISTRGSTAGVTLSGSSITVIQSPIAVSGNEYRSFNENGITYIYIAFR